MHRNLERAIVESISRKFVQGLIDQTPTIYLDSYHGLYSDPGLNPESAESVLGHYRRGLYETFFLDFALDCGYKAWSDKNSKKFNYTLVQAGQFLLAQSHFVGKIENLQASKFREQLSQVNWYAKQMDWLDDKPVPPNNIFAIVLHSTNDSDSSKHGDLVIGIPSENNKSFINHFDLETLLELYPQPTEPEPTKSPNLIKLK